MPFYVLTNKAPFAIQVQEEKRPADPWIVIEPDQSVPLWPKSTDCRRLHVRAGDDETVSRPFKFDEAQCTLLKLKNRVCLWKIEKNFQTTKKRKKKSLKISLSLSLVPFCI